MHRKKRRSCAHRDRGKAAAGAEHVLRSLFPTHAGQDTEVHGIAHSANLLQKTKERRGSGNGQTSSPEKEGNTGIGFMKQEFGDVLDLLGRTEPDVLQRNTRYCTSEPTLNGGPGTILQHLTQAHPLSPAKEREHIKVAPDPVKPAERQRIKVSSTS